jgi:ribose transport system ATP-binding protein
MKGRISQVPRKLLEMNQISKLYPGVKALNNVDFELEYGEVHALVGENGAGKSTLMKILSGAVSCDEGKIKLNGKEVRIENPETSIKMGIAAIYQERSLIPYLSAGQNILLGHEPVYSHTGLINYRELHKRAKELLNKVAPDIPTDVPVKYLSAAQQQLVEIAKAISLDADIIIMDEPTASLTEKDTAVLFKVIKSLISNGKSIVYISHRMKEIFEIAHRITVLRDGCKVKTLHVSEANNESLIKLMVGRNLENLFQKTPCRVGEVALKVENLKRTKVFSDISFEVRKGEVLGIAGLVGSGRTEVARAIFGADRLDEGKIFIENKPVSINSPVSAIRKGLGLIPEERKDQGLILRMAIKSNLTLAILAKLINMFGFIKRKKQAEICKNLIGKLNIKAYGIEQRACNLSGGNQQKIVIGKWLAKNCKILILDEPTRGIDVGAKAEIYRIIDDLAQKGIAIVVISSELIELLGICDRILVMKEGKLVANMPRKEATEEKIMYYFVGGNQN